MITVALCIDDRGGMLFGGRRQSRDRIQLADLLALCESEGKKLCISSFSASLLADFADRVAVDDLFLEHGEPSRICFVEDRRLAQHIENIERIIIYRWNRKYPFDLALDIDLEKCGFKLSSSVDIKGHSHEKITKEIYKK